MPITYIQILELNQIPVHDPLQYPVWINPLGDQYYQYLGLLKLVSGKNGTKLLDIGDSLIYFMKENLGFQIPEPQVLGGSFWICRNTEIRWKFLAARIGINRSKILLLTFLL